MTATADFSTLSLAGLDLILALHTTQDPTAAEWQRYLDLLEKSKKKHGGDISKLRSLIVSDGGAPNAKQREMSAGVAIGSIKMAGITHTLSNPLKRGIATAISWANPAFKAVMPSDWQDALRHLNVEGHIRPILLELETLQRRLPPVNSLALLVAETRSIAS